MTTSLLLVLTLMSPVSISSVTRQGGASNDSAVVVNTHRAWWRAFTLGDTARLQQLSDARLTVTMSTGRTLTRAEAVADASLRGDSTTIRLGWDAEGVRMWKNAAVVTSHFTESIGDARMDYRFITVLTKERGMWLVAAVQSTRVPQAPVAVSVPFAVLSQYAGDYRTPGGQTLRVVAADSSLRIIPPQGQEQRLTALAPTIFDLPTAQVRFVFERGENGRVSRLVVLRQGGAVAWDKLP